MFRKLIPVRLVFAAIIPFCMLTGAQAEDGRSPAGQMCPEGAYVIGFDSDSNIVCSGAVPTPAPVPPDAARQAESPGFDECPPDCSPKVPGARGEAAAEVSVTEQHAEPVVAMPMISKLKPRSVVFGARETSIMIIGSGFSADSVVKFQGGTYSSSVNPEGTELRATITTRDLSMGPYAISVSNGPGLETTMKRALEVF